MKLLRLYFLGFLISLEACSLTYTDTQKELAVFFEDNLSDIFSDLIANEFVQRSILILQA